MAIIEGTAYWASLTRPNEKFEPMWRIDLAVDSKSAEDFNCLLYTSPSPRDLSTSRMPSSA